MATTITIEPVALGQGWEATRAWITGGPIVLIQANSPTGQIVKSRLDMQKLMFIDPLPIKAKKANVQHLVQVVNASVDTSHQ
jgi:uncharacterized membrane protein YcaP (DUF421 family)